MPNRRPRYRLLIHQFFSSTSRPHLELPLQKCLTEKNWYYTLRQHKLYQKAVTAWSVQIGSFFWSVFSRIRIQLEYRKIRTRKNSVFGHFSRSAFQLIVFFWWNWHSFLLRWWLTHLACSKKLRECILFANLAIILLITALSKSVFFYLFILKTSCFVMCFLCFLFAVFLIHYHLYTLYIICTITAYIGATCSVNSRTLTFVKIQKKICFQKSLDLFKKIFVYKENCGKVKKWKSCV